MNGAKAKELRTLAPHVHCYACGCAIGEHDEGGMAEVLQPIVVPGKGIGFKGRAVSLCSACLVKVEEQRKQAEQEANARGRLVVARAQVQS